MMRGQKGDEDSDENDKRGIVEKLSNGDMLKIAFDFDLDAILLGYPRYAEHTEQLHQHHWKVKNSSLPAVIGKSMGTKTVPEKISY